MGEWKDTTSYSYGERGTREPREWSIGDEFPIIVTIYLSRYGEGWMLTCHAINLKSVALGTDDVTKAKRLGLAKAKAHARALAKAVCEVDRTKTGGDHG